MEQEKLKRWVRSKIESGKDPDRVRKVLKEEGHDPGLVDEVLVDMGRKEPDEDNQQVQNQEDASDDEESKSQDRQEAKKHDWQKERKSKDEEGRKLSVKDSYGSVKELSENSVRKLEDEVSGLGNVFSSVTSSLLGRWKVVALLSVLLISLIGFYQLPVQSAVSGIELPETSSLLNSGDDKPGEKVSKESEDLPAGVKVYLEDGVSDPSRVSVGSSEQVVFVNREGQDLEFEFDSGREGFTVKAGSHRIAEFDSITYYSASLADSGEDIKGSVVAQ